MQPGSGTGHARERQQLCGCLSPVSKINLPPFSSSVFLYQLLHENTLNQHLSPFYVTPFTYYLLHNNQINAAWLSPTQRIELFQPFKRLLEYSVPITLNFSREIYKKAASVLLLARPELGCFGGLPACEIAICGRTGEIFPMYLQG